MRTDEGRRTKNESSNIAASIESLSYSTSSPFDDMASDYDRAFTQSIIGSLMRRAVWQRMDVCFAPGYHVLEIGCGTGEDAVYLGQRGVHVLATDASSAMVQVARHKAARAGLNDKIEVEQLSIEELDSVGRKTKDERRKPDNNCRMPTGFDGVLSNFGALNCVADLRSVAAGIATLLRPGATALLCIMGPLVPWEWGWFLTRRQPAKAWRRLRRGGTSWRGLTIRYPSIQATRRAFAPWFGLRRATAIGALVPPSYAEAWAVQHPTLLKHLDYWERRLESVWPLPLLADHYLLELERR